MSELEKMLRTRKWIVKKNGNTRGTLINMSAIKSRGKAIVAGTEEMGENLTLHEDIQVRDLAILVVRLVI